MRAQTRMFVVGVTAILIGGCGVGRALLAPVAVPLLCLDNSEWCKPVAPGTAAGTLRLQNDTDEAIVGLQVVDEAVAPLHAVSAEETPLVQGQYVDVQVPAGVWREIRVLWADGSVRSFPGLIVPPEGLVELRLE